MTSYLHFEHGEDEEEDVIVVFEDVLTISERVDKATMYEQPFIRLQQVDEAEARACDILVRIDMIEKVTGEWN